MELWQGLLLLTVGCVSGFLNVVAGGGSLLSVPIMVFMGMPGPVANGTNRIAIFAQCATAVVTFFKQGYSDFRLSLTLALAALPGSILGAFFGTQLEGAWFNRVLALIMVGVMLIMALEKKAAPSSEATGTTKNLVLGHVMMCFVGCYGGFIQLGVGFIIMPVLNKVMGMDLVRVNMHKVFIIMVYTLASLMVFASQVEVLWLMGICLAVGTSIGGWLGARVTISKGEKLIKVVLNMVLTAFIAKLLFFN